MKYFTVSRRCDDDPREISKRDAKEYLDVYYKPKFVEWIFKKKREFRLFTPYRDVWTETDEGIIPKPGFYGVVGELEEDYNE